MINSTVEIHNDRVVIQLSIDNDLYRVRFDYRCYNNRWQRVTTSGLHFHKSIKQSLSAYEVTEMLLSQRGERALEEPYSPQLYNQWRRELGLSDL